MYEVWYSVLSTDSTVRPPASWMVPESSAFNANMSTPGKVRFFVKGSLFVPVIGGSVSIGIATSGLEVEATLGGASTRSGSGSREIALVLD